jgi:tRNA modification GTPase
MKIADSPAETIVAVATPPGRGALGVIRLSGPRAAETASPFLSFKRFSSLSQLPARQAVLAEFHLNATRLDQVVATLYRAPHSYTGEDMLEISCHGSGSVLRQAVAALERGSPPGRARRVQPEGVPERKNGSVAG